MDTIRQKKNTSTKRVLTIIAGTTALVFSTVLIMNIGDAKPVVQRSEIVTAVVDRSPMNSKIKGYGKLTYLKAHWISSETDGKVSQLLVQKGDHVEKGQAIASLKNRTLDLEFNDLKLDVELSKAEHDALLSRNQSTLLMKELSIEKIKSNLISMEFRLKAEQQLIEKKVISHIDYERTKLDVLLLKKELSLEKKLLEQQRISHSKEEIVAQNKLKKIVNKFNLYRSFVENLTVRSTVTGIIEDLNFELGQQIKQGENVAKIIDRNQLIARLNIREKYAQEIEKNQIAKVTIRNEEFDGLVTHIYPNVKDGQIQVDITLEGSLESIPSDTSLTGEIITSTYSDTMHVNKPNIVDDHVFIVKGNIASKVPVTFGNLSSDRVVVLDGLDVGDEIIISDTSAWHKNQLVRIN